MFFIHGRTVVFVTVDAFELSIIRRRGMTIGTVIPPAGAVFVSRTDREILLMREECGRLPAQRTMTCGAIGREPRCSVIRTDRLIIFLPVARYAFTRSLSVLSVRVTL